MAKTPRHLCFASFQKVVSAALILGDALVITYGSSEAAFVSTAGVINDEDYKDFMTGRPLNNVQVKIVDKDGGELPHGEHGSIVVKGPYLLRGYYNGKPASSILTPDGFLHIGDVGFLDNEGNLYVTGRDDSSYLQDRRVIYLEWPEQVLSRCPDVREVIVIKFSDLQGTEKICACVIPHKGSGLTESRLLKFYVENFHKMRLPTMTYVFPVLQGIIFFEDSFPLTYTGKPCRRKLKEMALKRFVAVKVKSKH